MLASLHDDVVGWRLPPVCLDRRRRAEPSHRLHVQGGLCAVLQSTYTTARASATASASDDTAPAVAPAPAVASAAAKEPPGATGDPVAALTAAGAHVRAPQRQDYDRQLRNVH